MVWGWLIWPYRCRAVQQCVWSLQVRHGLHLWTTQTTAAVLLTYLYMKQPVLAGIAWSYNVLTSSVTWRSCVTPPWSSDVYCPPPSLSHKTTVSLFSAHLIIDNLLSSICLNHAATRFMFRPLQYEHWEFQAPVLLWRSHRQMCRRTWRTRGRCRSRPTPWWTRARELSDVGCLE